VILNRSAPFFLSSARVDLPLLLKANAGFFMRLRRERLFAAMQYDALSATRYFHIPAPRN
jgi:hypothetical protein